MKDRTTIAALSMALLSVLILSSTALAFIDTSSPWFGYHFGTYRDGWNRDCRNLNAGILTPIFTFPRMDDSVLVGEKIVDDGSAYAEPQGTWTTESLSDAWLDRYSRSTAVFNPQSDRNKPNPVPPSWAFRWSIPEDAVAGSYRIYIWVPTLTGVPDGGEYRTATRYAHYRVIDADVTGPIDAWSGYHYEQDLTEGGKWIPLDDRTYRYDGVNPIYVELDQYTKDALHNDNPINNPGLGEGNYGTVYLLADAVKFVQDTDREIWASPAAGSIMYAGYETPVVFVGMREGPNASHTNVPALGAMYSVLSIQDNLGALDSDDVGKPIWKYPVPVDPNDPSIVSLGTRLRHPLEGPIGSVLEDRDFAGVYSSPVFFHLPEGDVLPSGSTSVVAFGASDRQVYCLDAKTGELVWKGPGVTVSEGNNDTIMWPQVTGRNDAFGGSYMRYEATPNGTNDMVWTREAASDPKDAAAYAVYAWLPGKTAGEVRVPDAVYEITYKNSKGDSVSTKVTVKMDNDDAQGVWVRLGESYWEPTEVRLKTTTSKTDQVYHVVADAVMFVPEDVKNFSYSSPMVTLRSDTSMSPPKDSPVVGNPYRLIIGNVGGRVYAFDLRSFPLGSNDKKTIRLAWTYPKPRSSPDPINPDEMGGLPLGPISSSIAIDCENFDAYFTTGNGRIYKLGAIGDDYPRTEWIYPNPNAAGKEDTTLAPFTASPALSRNYVYAACSDGYLYRLEKESGSDGEEDAEPVVKSIPLKAEYTDPPIAGDELALGAFRYATPAVIQNSAGIETVYVASTDGRVYAFESHSAGLRKHSNWERRPIDTDDYRETAFSLWSPMQAAPCVDGGYASIMGSAPGLYVACQDGAAYWLDSYDARYLGGWQTEGIDNGIFASPVVANSYLYIGGTDGRLYAFSNNDPITGAWGGQWVGGGSGPPGQKIDHEPNPSGDAVQVDIFSRFPEAGAHPIYQETLDIIDMINNHPSRQPGASPLKQQYRVDAADLSTIAERGIWRTNASGNSILDATTGNDMLTGHSFALRNKDNQHFLEWGQDMYVIAWNIDDSALLRGSGSPHDKRGSVTFRMYNASAGSGSGMLDISKGAEFLCEYETIDTNPSSPTHGSTVIRCVAGTRIQIGQSSSRPPSPGYGWVVTCTVNGKSVQEKSVVPELTGSGPANREVKNKAIWVEQKIGINNPLGIKAKAPDGLTWVQLGWVPASGMGADASSDVTAHFNGNSGENTGAPGTLLNGLWPTLPFGEVAHGTDSNQLQLGVVDRSALGLMKTTPQAKLDKFRIQNRDLHWMGGVNSVLFRLPWDWPPPYQKDYPDIYKRYESFYQEPDGSDPSVAQTALIPVAQDPAYPGSYYHSRLIPQAINTTVRVPRFQPANLNGYFSRNIAYVDSNNNGNCETGEVFNRRVNTYQEAYREFDMRMTVPPDFRMTVEESTIDIGTAPHGLGIGLPFYAGNSYANPSGIPELDVGKWFKEVTVKNQGNVNLLKLGIVKYYDLYSESGGINFPIPGTNIRSSLDPDDPVFGAMGNPFVHPEVGATISKARVGDVDATILKLPDPRRYVADPAIKGTTEAAWQAALGSAYSSSIAVPQLPKVSVQVPLSQPRGVYGQQVSFVADMPLGSVRPISQPFMLTVDVREDRMTDGFTHGTMAMINAGVRDPNTGKDLASGDVQPAAWRDKPNPDDKNAGSAYLIWSSNRSGTDTLVPVTPYDPWYLFQAKLGYDGTQSPAWCGWLTAPSNNQWWQPTMGSNPPEWLKFPNSWPVGNPIPESIKHTAPFVAVDNDPMDTNVAWLFWQGQADVPVGTGMKREYRIFYTDATGGSIVAPGSYFTFGKDPSQVKMQPRAVTYLSGNGTNERRLMWLFWYGGSNGRWNIYYSQNDSPARNHDEGNWSPDNVLTTPAALAAVSEPMPIRRSLGQGVNVTTHLDVIYTGLFKQGQNSDIMLTRYETGGGNNPQLAAKTLPRQYGEVLKRDTKRNVFQAAHIGWVKPSLNLSADEYFDYTPTRNRWYTPNPNDYLNTPFIKVVIPVEGKPNDPLVLYATNGAMPAGKVPGQVATLSRDTASGTYVYTYTDERKDHLGQMIIDPSAGTVRFTKTLPPGAKVVAEYTPQTLRLTQGIEADISPFALLEKTENMNPGFYPIDKAAHQDKGQNTWRIHPIDRLWVFWRKPNPSGVQTSTIYYKTYRLTLKLHDNFPIAMDSFGKPLNLTITGNVGPYEVDPTGTRIYFTERDEKYFKGPGLPQVITVKYTAMDVAAQKQVDKEVIVDGLLTLDGSHNRIVWEQELPHDRPDQALLGWGAETQKNEGQVCAFADIASDRDPWYKNLTVKTLPNNVRTPDRAVSTPTRLWVFWMSTRAGNTDLYYETICPSIGAERR